MTATHGMDVQEVELLGTRLREASQRVSGLCTALDGEVRRSPWIGPDADRFRTSWWPEHRGNLGRVAADLDGFARSAQHNATEQQKASEVAGASGPGAAAATTVASGIAAGRVGAGPAARTEGAPGPPSQGTTPDPSSVGGSSGSLPGSTRDWTEVDRAYRSRGASLGLTPLYLTGGSAYQCTAWANFRWAELRAASGLEPAPLVTGNGGQMATNAGGTTSTLPTLGAMVSSPARNHVMIVEEITQPRNGQMEIRVSEFNTDRNWKVATADEYRSDVTYTRGADGRWRHGSTGAIQDLVIANLR